MANDEGRMDNTTRRARVAARLAAVRVLTEPYAVLFDGTAHGAWGRYLLQAGLEQPTRPAPRVTPATRVGAWQLNRIDADRRLRLRDIRRANGLCIVCGDDSRGVSRCLKCRLKQAAWTRTKG